MPSAKRVVVVKRKAPIKLASHGSNKTSFDELRSGGIKVREDVDSARKNLFAERKKLEELESGIKSLNAASKVLVDMFGTNNISIRALSGAKIDVNSPNTAIRNRVIGYIGKSKGLKVRNMPNASDIRTILRGLKAAESLGYDARNLMKGLAVIKSSVDKLEAELRHVEKSGMSGVLRSRVKPHGADALTTMRNMQDKASSALRDVRNVEDKVNEFLRELTKVKTLRHLQSRGIDIDTIKKQADDVSKQLAALESAYNEDVQQQKIFEKNLASISRNHDKWVAHTTDKIKKRYAGDKKRIEAELVKLEQAAKNRLDIRQGNLGLSGLHDRSRKISETTISIDKLKALLSKLMLQAESFSVDVGNKTLEQRELELREYLKQGAVVRTIKKRDPTIESLRGLKKSDAWEDIVKSALSDKSKLKTFPSIGVNASAILHKAGTNLDLAPKFEDATADVKAIIGYGIDDATTWFNSNLVALATKLATLSILSSANLKGLEAVKNIDAIIGEFFRKIKDSFAKPETQRRLEQDIATRGLVKKHAPRGLGIDVSSKVYIKVRAKGIVSMVQSPSYTGVNGLRSKTALAFKQQLNDWVSRNIRFEEG